jgi:hypothetical protein
VDNQFRRIDGDSKVLDVRICWRPDEFPDASYLEQEGFEDALRDYQNDEFYFEGCWAESDIVVNGVVQTIKSGGLWGIESRSDADYKRSIEEEEAQALKDILVCLGYTVENLDNA